MAAIEYDKFFYIICRQMAPSRVFDSSQQSVTGLLEFYIGVRLHQITQSWRYALFMTRRRSCGRLGFNCNSVIFSHRIRCIIYQFTAQHHNFIESRNSLIRWDFNKRERRPAPDRNHVVFARRHFYLC